MPPLLMLIPRLIREIYPEPEPEIPAGEADPYWDNVAILLKGEGEEGGILFPDSSLSNVVTRRTSATTSQVQKKFGISSMYFPAIANNNVAWAYTRDFVFGTGDFTVESWVFLTQYATDQSIVDFRPSISNGSYVLINVRDNGVVGFYVNGAWRIQGGTVPLNTWTHVAVARRNGVSKLFVGGVAVGSWVDATNYANVSSSYDIRIGKNTGSTTPIRYGYLDEFRITKGVARYVNDFVPYTASAPVIGDTYDRYWDATVLLMHMDGADGSTALVDEKLHTFSNTAHTLTSGKFGQALLLNNETAIFTSGADLALGTEDFTVEFFHFRTNANASGKYAFSTLLSIGTYTEGKHLTFAYTNGSKTFGVVNQPKLSLISSTSLAEQQWHHVAVCRASGVTKLYVNGLLIGTITDLTTQNLDSQSLYINGNSVYLDGGSTAGSKLEELRITRGVARYTAEFIAPRRAFSHEQPSFDLYRDNVAAFVRATDSAIVEETGKTITQYGTPTIVDGAYGKAIQLNGTTDYLTLPDSSHLELGAGDFTVECFINTTTTAQYATLVSRTVAGFGSGSWALMLNSSTGGGNVTVWCSNFSGAMALLTTTGVNVTDGANHHIAWVRKGNLHLLLVDGVVRASASASFTIADAALPVHIGRDQQFGRFLNGRLEDVRISRVARYSNNFKPIAASLLAAAPDFDPYWSNVSLLLHAEDFNDATGANTVSNVGTIIDGVNGGFRLTAHDTYVSIANSTAFDFGSTDFTIELQAKVEAVGTAGTALIGRWGMAPTTNTDWMVHVDNTKRLVWASKIGGTLSTNNTSYVFADTNFHHIAVSRKGNAVLMFVDGVQVGSFAVSGTVQYTAAQPIRLGIWDDASSALQGNIKQLRITNGIARYVGNFIPPARALPCLS